MMTMLRSSKKDISGKILIFLLLSFFLFTPGLSANVQVLSTSPTNNATNILTTRNAIYVTFNSNIYGPSLNNSIVTCTGYPDIPLNYLNGSGTKTIGLSLGNFLSCGTVYTIVVSGQACTGPQSFYSYSNFSSMSGLNKVGNTYVTNGATNSILRLTHPSASQAGAVWFSNMLAISNGFTCKFQFRILYPNGGGADGLAFCIDTNNVAAIGGQMGYSGLVNSYVVEFDTYNNGGNDPNGNHIACYSAGRGQPTLSSSVPRCIATPAANMKDGAIHLVMIRYVPGTLQVFMDDTNTPLLIDNVNMWTLINMVSNRKARIGLSASTGGTWEAHEILNWSFKSGSAVNYLGADYPVQFTTAKCPVWSADTNLTFGPSPAWYPSVAVDMSNQLNVVFQDIRAGLLVYGGVYSRDIFYKRNNGIGWTPDVRVSPNDGFSGNTPDIACYSNLIYVTWLDFMGRLNQWDNCWDIWFTKSADRGATWSTPTRISSFYGYDNQQGPAYPKIAVEPKTGKICISYDAPNPPGTYSHGLDMFAAISADKGQTWNITDVMAGMPTQTCYEYASLAACTNGYFYMVFDSSSFSGPMTGLLYTQYNGTSWSAPSMIYSYNDSINLSDPGWYTALTIMMPDIAVKDPNNIYIAFTGDPLVKTRGVYFTKSVDGGTTWSAPVRLAGNESDVPRILYDRRGQICIIYEANKGYLADEKTQVSDIMLATSGDNGNTWTYQILETGQYAGNPKIVQDKLDNHLRLIWVDNRTSDWRVYYKTGP